MINLNKDESLKTVICFLQIYYSQTSSPDTAFIIEELENKSFKSTIRKNWEKILNKSLPNFENDENIVFLENVVFEAMIKLLEQFYFATKSDDIGGLLSDLLHIGYGATADPAAWYEWQDCVKKAKGSQI